MVTIKPSDVEEHQQAQSGAFDRVIAPMIRAQFLSEFWAKKFVHIAGQKGRFVSLLPWEELNAILERHSLEPPRLRLFRNGKPVDSKRFLRAAGTHRLQAAGLANCLSEGATLILDRVDDLSPGARELAEASEEVFRATASVNLYAGWRTKQGFDLHWDDQDTIILQLSGRKRWRVHEPTRMHPLKDDVKVAPKPSGKPFWDGMLEDGDIIHLPRGWWHEAIPLDEPSLHLTLTILPADGVELLRWLTNGLKRHAEIRMNVPSVASETDRGAYLSRVRELVSAAMSDDILDRFLVDWEAKVNLRPRLRLPEAPMDVDAPIHAETRVRLAGTRRLSFDEDEESGSVFFWANGVRWECSPAMTAALASLRGATSQSVHEMCSRLLDPDAKRELLVLLGALAMGGVVWTDGGRTPAPKPASR